MAEHEKKITYVSNPFGLVAPSIDAFLLNAKTWLIAFLLPLAGLMVLVGVPAALYGGAVLFGLDSSVATAVAIISGLAALIVGIVYGLRLSAVAAILSLAGAHKKQMTFKETYEASKAIWARVLWTSMLSGLAIASGFLLFIIPGIVFAVWFSLSVYIAVEEGLGAVDSMKRSKELVQGHAVEMLGLMGLAQSFGLLQVVPIVGALAGFVLQILFTPATAIRYLQLKELKAHHGTSKPHWTNYLLIVAPVILIVLSIMLGLYSGSTNPNTPTEFKLEQQ
jgi:hypothetical protein